MTITTTLAAIRGHRPCRDGWTKLLAYLGKTSADDEPLPLTVILDSNGIDDAFWCLRAVDGHEREIRLLSADFAEHVLPIFEQRRPGDDRPRKAIQTARDYAHGRCSREDLAAARAAARAAALAAAGAAARDAAGDAALAAAGAAARDAAWAAAWAAAWDAAGAAERQWQADHFRRWCDEVGR